MSGRAGVRCSAESGNPGGHGIIVCVTVWNVLIALAIGYVVWRFSIYFVRILSMTPEEIDPDDIKEVVQDYKCTVCGAEVIMTVANVSTEKAPRHCREEMVPVWRPD
jgi:hypothetical protein